MADSILVTGAAGFIGMHVARRLLADGQSVLGIDDLAGAGDPALAEARLRQLRPLANFQFAALDIVDRRRLDDLFAAHRFSAVVHLAARTGVRASLDDPHAYGAANLTGFLNVLEGCRRGDVGHLVFASSSSVYGANTRLPYSPHDIADRPLSLYAATKKANETMAHAYSHLYALPATGLRFFTVYGPWGRPDMAVFLFAKGIANGTPIKLFNGGRMRRDFTYIDDAIEAVARIIPKPPQPQAAAEGDAARSAVAPWRLYNVGNSTSVEVLRIVALLERELGRKAKIELLPMQAGDVPETCADIDDLMHDFGCRPSTPIEDGVSRFASWFRNYVFDGSTSV